MAYNKHNWESNELITEVSLNHMEQGIFDAYNRAERQIDDIIENSESLKQLIGERINNFLFSVDKEEEKISFKLIDQNNQN